MASAPQIIGYFFQIAGMLAMFYGFVMLVIGIQGITGSMASSISQQAGISPASQKCTDAEAVEGACEDFSTSEGLNAALNRRIFNFVAWLAAGLALLFIGLGMRAGGEMGGFFAKLLGKGKEKEKVPFGLRWRDVS